MLNLLLVSVVQSQIVRTTASARIIAAGPLFLRIVDITPIPPCWFCATTDDMRNLENAAMPFGIAQIRITDAGHCATSRCLTFLKDIGGDRAACVTLLRGEEAGLLSALMRRPPPDRWRRRKLSEAGMYRVEFKTDDRWMIFDGKNDAVFVGTKRQVEDWLDHQENVRLRPSVSGAWFRGLLHAFVWPFRRLSGCCHGRIDHKPS
jgi:hypothetical protein